VGTVVVDVLDIVVDVLVVVVVVLVVVLVVGPTPRNHRPRSRR